MESRTEGSFREIRNSALRALERKEPGSAVMLLQRLKSLGQFQGQDLLMLASAHYDQQQYGRALDILTAEEENSYGFMDDFKPKKTLLEMQCLFKLGEYEEVVQRASIAAKILDINNYQDCIQVRELLSSIYLVVGRSLKLLDKVSRAVQKFTESLRMNLCCVEAFDELIQCGAHYEIKSLLESAQFQQTGYQFMWDYYDAACCSDKSALNQKLKLLEEAPRRITRNTSAQIQEQMQKQGHPTFLFFGKSDDRVLKLRAEALWRSGNLSQCYAVTSDILKKNQFCSEMLPLHVAVCRKLGYKRELFALSHKLIERGQEAIAFYTIGSYYLVVQKFSQAEEFFEKSVEADPTFAPALMGLGDSYSAREGSDQAVAVYRKAARLFPGMHQPQLNLGIEYLHMNLIGLAQITLEQAKDISPSDPHIENELGVVHYKKEEYAQALKHFREVSHMVGRNQLAYWEPAEVNKANCLRKLRRYDEAIKTYQHALILKPGQAETYAALGYTYHLNDDLEQAVSCYQEALALAPNHTFASEMLEVAMQEEVVQWCTLDLN
eukprot:TRINITY_DN10290_c0_g2_i6.p1 TRINITY_DN10290_c0_g2~~TRINITY_DN10290_c0_g2_i6.p1  ORF type:complete len:551 (+),score=67.41 TRINITY_DN10290_c0_g2_i6:169-1821(+)